eukprot:gene6641-3298_t
MKKGQMYNMNPLLNKWEEDLHMRNMLRKIENVRGTIKTGVLASPSKKPPSGRRRMPSANSPACEDGGPAALDALINKQLGDVLGDPIIQGVCLYVRSNSRKAGPTPPLASPHNPSPRQPSPHPPQSRGRLDCGSRLRAHSARQCPVWDDSGSPGAAKAAAAQTAAAAARRPILKSSQATSGSPGPAKAAAQRPILKSSHAAAPLVPTRIRGFSASRPSSSHHTSEHPPYQLPVAPKEQGPGRVKSGTQSKSDEIKSTPTKSVRAPSKSDEIKATPTKSDRAPSKSDEGHPPSVRLLVPMSHPPSSPAYNNNPRATSAARRYSEDGGHTGSGCGHTVLARTRSDMATIQALNPNAPLHPATQPQLHHCTPPLSPSTQPARRKISYSNFSNSNSNCDAPLLQLASSSAAREDPGRSPGAGARRMLSANPFAALKSPGSVRPPSAALQRHNSQPNSPALHRHVSQPIQESGPAVLHGWSEAGGRGTCKGDSQPSSSSLHKHASQPIPESDPAVVHGLSEADGGGTYKGDSQPSSSTLHKHASQPIPESAPAVLHGWSETDGEATYKDDSPPAQKSLPATFVSAKSAPEGSIPAEVFGLGENSDEDDIYEEDFDYVSSDSSGLLHSDDSLNTVQPSQSQVPYIVSKPLAAPQNTTASLRRSLVALNDLINLEIPLDQDPEMNDYDALPSAAPQNTAAVLRNSVVTLNDLVQLKIQSLLNQGGEDSSCAGTAKCLVVHGDASLNGTAASVPYDLEEKEEQMLSALLHRKATLNGTAASVPYELEAQEEQMLSAPFPHASLESSLGHLGEDEGGRGLLSDPGRGALQSRFSPTSEVQEETEGTHFRGSITSQTILDIATATSKAGTGQTLSLAEADDLAKQTQALFGSLFQLNRLMNGPRGKELNLKTLKPMPPGAGFCMPRAPASRTQEEGQQQELEHVAGDSVEDVVKISPDSKLCAADDKWMSRLMQSMRESPPLE